MKNERRSSGQFLRVLAVLIMVVLLTVSISLTPAIAANEGISYDMKVVTGETHTLLRSGTDLYGWGLNDYGQLPGLESSYSVQPVKLLSNVADAAVSAGRSLVVGTDGVLTAYGLDPWDSSEYQGKTVATGVSQVAARDRYAAYITKDGALYTWGVNDSGQLGSANRDNSATPICVIKSGVVKVALGDSFALALTENGDVYGWGDNTLLQLGSESLGESVVYPTKLMDNAADIQAGFAHALFLKRNGVVFSCGDNSLLQTGTSSHSSCMPLTQIFNGAVSITAGDYHNFLRTSDGSVYAWGHGVKGQLGVVRYAQLNGPEETTMPFVQLFGGPSSSFGVDPEGALYAFGSNTNYVLGKEDGSDAPSPTKILDRDLNWIPTHERSELFHAAKEADEKDPVETAPSETAPVPSGSGGTPVTPGVTESDPTPTPAPADVDEPAPSEEVGSFLSGYGDGTFRPNKSVTRAEFLKMLVSATDDGEPKAEGWGQEDLFTDVDLNAWYASYVAAGKASGLVEGDDSGLFRPNEPITRADASIMVARALALDIESAIPSKFSDVPAGSYYAKYVDALTALGILKGDDLGNFNPRKNITRAEAAAVICRSVGFDPDADAVEVLRAANPTSPFTDVAVESWYYAYVLRGVGSAK